MFDISDFLRTANSRRRRHAPIGCPYTRFDTLLDREKKRYRRQFKKLISLNQRHQKSSSVVFGSSKASEARCGFKLFISGDGRMSVMFYFHILQDKSNHQIYTYHSIYEGVSKSNTHNVKKKSN